MTTTAARIYQYEFRPNPAIACLTYTSPAN